MNWGCHSIIFLQPSSVYSAYYCRWAYTVHLEALLLITLASVLRWSLCSLIKCHPNVLQIALFLRLLSVNHRLWWPANCDRESCTRVGFFACKLQSTGCKDCKDRQVHLDAINHGTSANNLRKRFRPHVWVNLNKKIIILTLVLATNCC